MGEGAWDLSSAMPHPPPPPRLTLRERAANRGVGWRAWGLSSTMAAMRGQRRARTPAFHALPASNGTESGFATTRAAGNPRSRSHSAVPAASDAGRTVMYAATFKHHHHHRRTHARLRTTVSVGWEPLRQPRAVSGMVPRALWRGDCLHSDVGASLARYPAWLARKIRVACAPKYGAISTKKHTSLYRDFNKEKLVCVCVPVPPCDSCTVP